MTPKRLVMVRVTQELLVSVISSTGPGEFLAGGKKVAVRGVPPDAKIVNARFDAETDQVLLLVSHPSFAEVPECHAVPELVVTYTAVE